MATISKFYFHDATSPDTGTLPSGALITSSGTAATGDATGARTARDATDIIGTANPDIESSISSNADTLQQSWGHRRFVSRPLAAQTITVSQTWTFSYARTESNLSHNQVINCVGYVWRPSTGARVGTGQTAAFSTTEPTVAAAEQSEQITALWAIASVTLSDGDILVFDVTTTFTQAMATSYTDNFAYDGNTEASTTTCASFITPPSALTLFTAAAAPALSRITMVGNAATKRSSSFCLGEKWARKGRLWVPSSDRPFAVGV